MKTDENKRSKREMFRLKQIILFFRLLENIQKAKKKRKERKKESKENVFKKKIFFFLKCEGCCLEKNYLEYDFHMLFN